MSNAPHLKYFNLEASIRPDMANGHLWQRFVHSLLVFHFKFHISITDIHSTLDSFRTPFWLEEKHWYVTYFDDTLFSIPHFIPTHMTALDYLFFLSTAPDHSFLSSHVNALTLDTMSTGINKRLPNIRTLILARNMKKFTRVKLTMSFHQVNHLSIYSFDQLVTIMPLENLLPQLSNLTIRDRITIEMIEHIRSFRLPQIRILELGTHLSHRQIGSILEELFHLFPNLEQLRYKSYIASVDLMLRLIHGFPHLSSAFFRASLIFFRKNEQFCRNPNLFLRNLSHANFHQTICRMHHSNNTQQSFYIDWTIQKRVCVILA